MAFRFHVCFASMSGHHQSAPDVREVRTDDIGRLLEMKEAANWGDLTLPTTSFRYRRSRYQRSYAGPQGLHCAGLVRPLVAIAARSF
jgi:hypothetical protein